MYKLFPICNRSSKRAPEQAEVVLSVVCTSLSLAGLAATFMTYVLFKNLRTAPGKNNMNLAITLFLAQLLYLVGSGQTEVSGLILQQLSALSFFSLLFGVAFLHIWLYTHMWEKYVQK